MTTVVTGAAGFIGRNLTVELLRRGHEVTAIDRRPDLPLGASRIVADLSSPDDRVARALTAADVVYHLAARSGVREPGPDVDAARHLDNVVATRNVLHLTPAETPVVVTSSSSVYGGSLQGGANRPCREDDELRPRGGYARSKVEVEELCRARSVRGGRVQVVRPFTVAGEGQRADMAISIWARSALAGRPLQIFGAPDRTRDITDVRDVVEGLIRVARLDRNATVNLGTGAGRTLAEIAAAVVEAVGRDPGRVVVEAGREEVPATLADVTHCRRLLGFVPSTDLGSLVRRQTEAMSLGGVR